jgi:hypothetical protein
MSRLSRCLFRFVLLVLCSIGHQKYVKWKFIAPFYDIHKTISTEKDHLDHQSLTRRKKGNSSRNIAVWHACRHNLKGMLGGMPRSLSCLDYLVAWSLEEESCEEIWRREPGVLTCESWQGLTEPGYPRHIEVLENLSQGEWHFDSRAALRVKQWCMSINEMNRTGTHPILSSVPPTKSDQRIGREAKFRLATLPACRLALPSPQAWSRHKENVKWP